MLADWRSQTRLQFCAAALAVVIVIGMVFLIVRKLRQQHAAAQHMLSEKTRHLDTAINNMTQGLLLFDASGRLVICNRQYIDMFGLSPDIVKPGCHLRDLIAHRQQRGSFVGDVDAYCAKFLDPSIDLKDSVTSTPDGRSIRLIFKRSPDGGWATTMEDVTEVRRVQARIEHLAHYDALTSLPNRTLFQRHAEKLLQTEGAEFAILYIDIDEFKRINDTLGHLIGDEFLKGVADRLRQSAGAGDFIARLGGDEFAVLQHGIAGAEDVHALVARIYQALRTPFDCHGHQLTSDASIGIAIAPRHGADLFDLLKNADLAMYAAKAAGRRTYRFFDPSMEQEANRRRELEADLRAALAQGGFELHYQPLVDLRSDEVIGCEALLRWRHPVRGMVSPADFVPVAEETGLIEEIGQWVLRTACAEAATWPAHVRIAVNVSPIQFKSETLPLKVAAALAETGLDPRRLELEITEAVLIADRRRRAGGAEPAPRARGSHRARRFRNRLFLAAISAAFSVRQDQDRPLVRQGSDAQFLVGLDHPRGGQHRSRPQHDHHGGRRRDAAPARDRAESRLHADAGLSVQRGAAGAGDPDAVGIEEGGRRGRGVSQSRLRGTPETKISKTTPCKVGSNRLGAVSTSLETL